jgi:hypothetical protein
MPLNSVPFIKFCVTGQFRLPGQHHRAVGRRAGALFFARHLDYFIVTQNSQPSPGLGTIKTNYRDKTTLCHLPGLAKNAAPRHGRQLIKPPGRYV